MAAAVDTLPDWAALNDLDFFDVSVENTEAHGLGLVAERALTRVEDTFDIPTLLRIPGKLVLSVEAVELYAKVDINFRQLLDVAGGQSTRGDILLFLLANLVLSTRSPASKGGGVPTPWTQYVKYLPTRIPVPTLWNDYERQLLEGTSLEPAVTAKLAALSAEFDHLREAVIDLPFWNDLLDEEGGLVSLEDWLLIDAWYRSRSLELPRAGPAMVPVLDMANHAVAPTAYYDEDRGNGDVILLLRPGCRVEAGEELTISYGADKSAAEMLFSYGFVDEATAPAADNKIVLPLDPLPDDPLARAKLHAFSGPRTVEITHRATTTVNSSSDDTAIAATAAAVTWSSPFAHFATLNEEDGLEFRVLQTTQGERQLRVFWLDTDVTDRTADFAALTTAHPTLAAVFRLRVVAVLADRVRVQLDRLRSVTSQVSQLDRSAAFAVRGECVRVATALRRTEEEGLAVALLLAFSEISSSPRLQPTCHQAVKIAWASPLPWSPGQMGRPSYTLLN